MKKFLKNKKLFIATALIAVLAISGSTFLWFISGNTLASDENVGRMQITVTETGNRNPNYFYEPGQTLKLSYKIDNEHEGAREGLYLPGFVKADFANGQVEIWSDENGNEIPPVLYDINRDHLGITVDVKSVFDVNGISMWYFDPNTGIYYNMIDAGMVSEPNVEIVFNGREMGNEYQGSVFKFNRDFIAVNVQEAAILDVHGLVLSDLLPIDDQGRMLYPNSIASASGNGYDYYMDILYDRVGK